MTARRWAAVISVAALASTGCGCSTSAPAAARRPASHPVSSSTTASEPAASSTTASGLSAVPTTVPTPVVPVPGWSSVLTVLPPAGGFSSVSCISDTFCIAVGGGTGSGAASAATGPGVAASWDGATWATPVVYLAAPATGTVTAPSLPAVSCTSGPTCVITDGTDHVSYGDGTTWSPPAALSPPPPLAPAPGPPRSGPPSMALSCPTPSLCALVDDSGQVFTYQDGTWLTPQAFGTTDGTATLALSQAGHPGVSCPATTTCVAVVGTRVLDWDGTGWSESPAPWTSSLASSTGDPTAISCPTTDLCLVVNGSEVSIGTPGGPWNPEQTIDSRSGLDSLSCASATFCVAADEGGSVLTWNGTSWSQPAQVVPAAVQYAGIGTSVSCPTVDFCMVINADGDYATYTAPGSR